MASLFDTNFTFSPPSSPTSSTDSTSATRSSSRAVSPCSLASAYPPPRFSVTDLASHFASQNLRTPNAQMAYDSCTAYANTDGDEEGWAIPSVEDNDTTTSLHRPRSHSPGCRAQRQYTTRLLCTAPHRGEIAALVARMVASGEQCAVSTSTAVHEDEGYSSDNDDMIMAGTTTSAASSRRPSLATTLSRSRLDSRGGGACVKKNVRLRKGAKERRTL